MYQAGVKKITLYENKGITYTFFDATNNENVTGLSSTGQVISIENLNRPKFEIDMQLSKSGFPVFEYSLDFILFGNSNENLNTIEKLKTSTAGWLMLVEFYALETKLYLATLHCRSAEIKPHEEMVFEVKMETMVPSLSGEYLSYTEGVFLPIYRADSTLITVDSTIITADYAL